MILSSLDGSRSHGGVDSVCQAHLRGLQDYNEGDDYIIIGFNPANDTERQGEPRRIAENIVVCQYDLGRPFGSGQLTPKLIANELLVRRLVRRHGPDVVHSHIPQWYIWKCHKGRKILSLHSYLHIAMLPVNRVSDFLHKRIIQPQSIRSADILTTVSREIEGLIRRAYAIPVHYIPNSVDPAFDISDRQVPPDGTTQLIIVGSVEPRKRQLDALEITGALRARGHDVELLIAGGYDAGDAYYQTLTRYVRDNNLDDRVTFPGLLTREQLRKRLARADIGLFLSDSETFGLAPLEMLLAGLPLIATRVGVFDWRHDEFAERGVAVIEPGDAGAAVSAVSEWITSGKRHADPRVISFIREQFSLEAVTGQYLSLYRRP